MVFKLINLDPLIELIKISDIVSKREYEKLRRIADIIIKQVLSVK